jgi:hypothetical protein
VRPLKPDELRQALGRRKRMTVCIAAICQEDKQNNEPRIVLCYDWKSESEFGGSETADKLRLLPKGWVALMADTLSRCEELVAQYETHLRKLEEVIDDKQLFEEMKKPAHKQKEVLANDYLWQTLGVSPDKKFPEEIVTKRLDEVARITLQAALIVAGFISTQQGDSSERETHPYLFVVDDQRDHENVVRVEENFAAIGTGSYVAIPSLHQRKRLAEVVPGVGEDTSLQVMYPDGKIMTWSDALFERCKWLFDRIGPTLEISDKKSSEYFELKDEYLEDGNPEGIASKRLNH